MKEREMPTEYKSLARTLAKFLLEKETIHSTDIAVGRLIATGAEFNQWFLNVARPRYPSERILGIFEAILEGNDRLTKSLEEFEISSDHDALNAKLREFEQLLRDHMDS